MLVKRLLIDAGDPELVHYEEARTLYRKEFDKDPFYKIQHYPGMPETLKELKKRGVRKLKVVYSDELPTRPINDMASSCRTNCICPPGAKHKCTERRDIPGSTAFVPSVAGLIIAGEVIRDLTKDVRVTAESVENQQ